jgi:hypothetical protein
LHTFDTFSGAILLLIVGLGSGRGALKMEIFDNSFWRSGYPIGIGILLFGFIIAKLNQRK